MTATIERNYRKHPHTARWLMRFHAATAGLPADLPSQDLLDLVPDEAPAYQLSPGQQKLIFDLVSEITELDAETGLQGADYNRRMTEHQAWTPENAKRWIGNLIAKKRELAARRPTVPTVQVADGRYAVEEDGVLKFFKVKNGRTAGFVFLDIQASSDWHAVRDVARIRRVLALIAVDPKAALIRYGQELGECGDCGRPLTDPISRARGIGPICKDK